MAPTDEFRTALDIEALQRDLERLATYGFGQLSETHGRWLDAVGIASRVDGALFHARTNWLSTTLPAQNLRDLLVRSLLRDPLYRLHLDVALSTVLQMVGATARWARLEDLLRGPFRSFAPRFVGLLEWLAGSRERHPAELAGRDWEEIKTQLGLGDEVFRAWDEACWGGHGDAPLLFPLLQQMYLPLRDLPVFLRIEPTEDLALYEVATAIVEAAQELEGARVTDFRELQELARRGVPVRWLPNADGSSTACLLAPVHLMAPALCAPSLRPFPSGVPAISKASMVIDPERSSEPVSLWETAPGSSSPTLLGQPAQAGSWNTATHEAAVPGWARLPTAASLEKVPLPRRSSKEADEALLQLSEHSLYGFLLQLLLLEALDRELGEETLMLAPPVRAPVADIEGETRLFYRPRPREGQQREASDLGQLDEVLAIVARQNGIEALPVCFAGSRGPWSAALRLMRAAKLVEGRHDRWTLATFALDRFHGGGLMTAVIRRGKELRERQHDALEALWATRQQPTLQGASDD